MDDRLTTLLRERFGLAGFRGGQREVVDHLLAGGDALVVWPTGSGKSLVYQLPALAQERPVVVLSPLIALMQDQVAALRARGIPATFINSTLDRAERDRRAAAFAAGRHRLLYVTPERFRNPAFLAAIDSIRVGLLAVDEAHCISAWGHDFRPEYGRVGRIRARLGQPPTVALTATATPAVQAEIRTRLDIPAARLFHGGIARPNLFLAATIVEDETGKWERVAARLARIPGAGIVYGALIRNLHRLEDFLAPRGQRLVVYHGDLSREERQRTHARFREPGPVRVLATRAFGMGVNKPDLRFILHHEVAGSIEELDQEVGRAGRDGRPSWCELFYCEQDLMIPMQFVRAANPDRRLFRAVARHLEETTARNERLDLETLRRAVAGRVPDGRVETCLAWLEALGVVEGNLERGSLRLLRPLEPDEEPEELGPEKERRDLERLHRVVDYVRTDGCRRRFLHEYFGLAPPAATCDACDRCVNPEEWLARNFPAAAQVPAAPGVTPDPAAATRGPERGDFVRIDGRFVGRVVRVSGSGRDARVEVEDARTLTTRIFPARRHRIERMERTDG